MCVPCHHARKSHHNRRRPQNALKRNKKKKKHTHSKNAALDVTGIRFGAHYSFPQWESCFCDSHTSNTRARPGFYLEIFLAVLCAPLNALGRLTSPELHFPERPSRKLTINRGHEDRFNQLKTNNVKWAFSELITSWKTVVQNNNRHGPGYADRFTQEKKWLRQQFSFSSASSLSPPLDVCCSKIGGYSMEDRFQTRWPSRSGF